METQAKVGVFTPSTASIFSSLPSDRYESDLRARSSEAVEGQGTVESQGKTGEGKAVKEWWKANKRQ